jgi:HlyD family secretion protein
MKTFKQHLIFAIFASLLMTACNNSGEISDAYGNFEADDVIVSAEVGGKLLNFKIEEGQTIKKDEIVAMTDTLQLYLQKKQMESQIVSITSRKVSIQTQIAVIQQQKANLERDKNRITNMLKDGAATQKQMDDVTGSIDVLEKQEANVKSQLVSLNSEAEVVVTQMAQIEDKLNRCKTVAPISGTVLETYKKEGEMVGQGQSLFKLADLTSLNLRVYVSGDQLPHVKIGQKVTVVIDDTKKTNSSLEGTVSWISSEAEFTPKIIQTKKERVKLVYAVKVKVPNDGTLKIGMPGEIRF